MTKQSLSFKSLDSLLSELQAGATLCEAHGFITGMLCVGPEYIKTDESFKEILLEALDIDETPPPALWSSIKKHKDAINKELNSNTYSFRLPLPDDDEDLAERLEQLALWTQSFLSGLGMMGVTSDDLNEDLDELIDDLVGIANVNPITASEEADEINFSELVEYVRVAVQNIHLEMHLSSDSQMLH